MLLAVCRRWGKKKKKKKKKRHTQKYEREQKRNWGWMNVETGKRVYCSLSCLYQHHKLHLTNRMSMNIYQQCLTSNNHHIFIRFFFVYNFGAWLKHVNKANKSNFIISCNAKVLPFLLLLLLKWNILIIVINVKEFNCTIIKGWRLDNFI